MAFFLCLVVVLLRCGGAEQEQGVLRPQATTTITTTATYDPHFRSFVFVVEQPPHT